MNNLERIQQHGEVFTLPAVASFMLDRVAYTPQCNLAKISVLEPAAGNGAFAIEIINRLKSSAKRHSFDFLTSLTNIYFTELNNENVRALKNRLRLECGLSVVEIERINIFTGDFLMQKFTSSFDLIVGNPPYVRWDNLEKSYREKLAKQFKTFTGRADLYIAFYEKCLHLLKPQGALNFLCSNRWFKAAYGKRLRTIVQQRFSVKEVLDMEELNPFTQTVLGYPAITLIQNERRNYFEYVKLKHLAEIDQKLSFRPFKQSYLKADIWTFDFNYNNLLDTKYYAKIQDCGYDIKIGIATGKDQVFIGKNLSDFIEKDRVIPLIKAKHLKKCEPSNLGVIDCFDRQKRRIDLEQYPRLKSYLYHHYQVLNSRYIAKKNPDNWYRTIDKIRYQDIDKPKILLPDINGSHSIFLGGEGYYPHHNIYYITSQIDRTHLEILAGILSSTFIKEQLAKVSNKMNGGYPRWQSQNIRRLIIPNVHLLSDAWKNDMAVAYRQQNFNRINDLVKEEIVQRAYTPKQELLLFD